MFNLSGKSKGKRGARRMIFIVIASLMIAVHTFTVAFASAYIGVRPDVDTCTDYYNSTPGNYYTLDIISENCNYVGYFTVDGRLDDFEYCLYQTQGLVFRQDHNGSGTVIYDEVTYVTDPISSALYQCWSYFGDDDDGPDQTDHTDPRNHPVTIFINNEDTGSHYHIHNLGGWNLEEDTVILVDASGNQIPGPTWLSVNPGLLTVQLPESTNQVMYLQVNGVVIAEVALQCDSGDVSQLGATDDVFNDGYRSFNITTMLENVVPLRLTEDVINNFKLNIINNPLHSC